MTQFKNKMKASMLLGIAAAIVASMLLWIATATAARNLQGSWDLRIENMKHVEVATLTIRLTDQVAPSCMSGKWKRVIVEKSKTTDPKFFPVSEPLSYQVEDDVLTLGRNEVCDWYLHLKGTLVAKGASGTYTSFGIQGGEQRGNFTLKQNAETK